jgi:hypothetical protein
VRRAARLALLGHVASTGRGVPPNTTKHAVASTGARLDADYIGTVVSLGKGQQA